MLFRIVESESIISIQYTHHTSLLQQHQQIGRLIRPHLNTSAAIGWCALRYGWSPRCHGFVNLDPSALEGEAHVLISADYVY